MIKKPCALRVLCGECYSVFRQAWSYARKVPLYSPIRTRICPLSIFFCPHLYYFPAKRRMIPKIICTFALVITFNAHNYDYSNQSDPGTARQAHRRL